ncbi:MAG: L,D-transpeptidase family protein, partial [Gammaproteobacteria bacterium]
MVPVHPRFALPWRTLAWLMPLVLLGACTVRERQPLAPPPVVEAPPPPPLDPLGVPTHRFEFDPSTTDVVGVLQSTVVGKDDVLPDIARRFNLGYEEIVRANPGVDPWLPGEGRRVLLPTRFVLPDAPRDGVVVNLAAMRLFWFPKREPGKLQVVYTYPIGIGRVGWVTPEGSTKVVTRVKDPVWRPPVSVRREHAANGEILPKVVPAGPDNPLGAHMFRLGWPSYLIHGTNKPYGVGMRSSHGCLRLYPEDIARL